MKIIHCADVHLDSKLRTNLTNEQARERRNELLITFEKMIAYAVEQDVKAILIAGDLFDTGNVTVKTRNAVASAITENPRIDFYYLFGNHDADNFILSWEELPKNLHLFSEKWITYELETFTISGIEIGEENKNTMYESLVLNPEKQNIVMLHGQEATYQGKDKTEIIQIPALANKFIDYLALGHIHSYKIGDIDHRGAYCYSGCLEGRGYDECGEKGFVLLNIENGSITPSFIPFAKRNIHEVKIDISGLETTSKIDQKISKEVSLIPSKDMLKVVLTGKVSITSERDLSYLETKYKESFYSFKIEDDLVRLQLNPKDYEKDASLKGEFIRLLMGKHFSDEQESAIIELGLKALAGEEVDK